MGISAPLPGLVVFARHGAPPGRLRLTGGHFSVRFAPVCVAAQCAKRGHGVPGAAGARLARPGAGSQAIAYQQVIRDWTRKANGTVRSTALAVRLQAPPAPVTCLPAVEHGRLHCLLLPVDPDGHVLPVRGRGGVLAGADRSSAPRARSARTASS